MSYKNLKAHDEVVLIQEIPDYSSTIHKGDKGTVVYIYLDTRECLVGFFNLDGSHKVTLTLSPDVIDKF